MRYYLLGLWLLSSQILYAQLDFIEVFVSGQEGYHTYRIPSIVQSKEGVLLAFAEGRSSRSDHARNDIVLKRSLDQGISWSELQTIFSAGERTLNNPQAVVLENGRILLMFQEYPEAGGEGFVVPGYDGPYICRSYISYSDDAGATWSVARDITKAVKRPTYVTSVASGPGIGIQLMRGPHKGRILMPFNQGPFGYWQVYMAYSDDQGEEWTYGEVAFPLSEGWGNEVQVVERSDGSILLNARSDGGQKHRKVAYSLDGGHNWSGLIDDTTLVEPQCQASIIRHSFTPSIIAFANPANSDQRTKGSIRLSYDEGKSWPVEKLIYPGSFAYCCLVSIDPGKLGLLFEADDYGRIVFVRIPLSCLEN